MKHLLFTNKSVSEFQARLDSLDMMFDISDMYWPVFDNKCYFNHYLLLPLARQRYFGPGVLDKKILRSRIEWKSLCNENWQVNKY